MNRVLLGLATILLSSAWGQTDWPSYGHDQTGQRYLRALNIETGDIVWEVPQPDAAKAKSWSGVLATADTARPAGVETDRMTIEHGQTS